jgi:hypothetical protein
MLQTWSHLTFLHWRYPVAAISSRIPPGLSVDVFDGSAWVGITPFLLQGLRPPFLPALPWISRFLETNCRTYVTGADGKPAVWFFSLDCARLLASIAARLSYGLPYTWSQMSMRIEDQHLTYRSWRRWPDRLARTQIEVQFGDPIRPGDLETFLTARFRLYSVRRGRLVYADIDHPPWPLCAAEALHVEQSVTTAAGLSLPQGNPVVHYSPGTMVRVGPPDWL